MSNQKKYVNGIYGAKKDFNNGMPPFFKLKIDLEKMYQYVDEEGYLKLDMFQKKNNEKEYYFVLNEYEKNDMIAGVETGGFYINN